MFKRIGDEVVRLIYEFGIFKFDKSESVDVPVAQLDRATAF